MYLRSRSIANTSAVVHATRRRRRAGIVSAFLIMALMAIVVAPAARGDVVTAYLERHGMNELLAVHLEEKLERTRGDEREDLILHLARVYAALLDEIDDDRQRAIIEHRSRQLIAQAPSEGVHELRLALARQRFREAEAIAEDHRLRLADDDSLAEARDAFTEVAEELREVRRHLQRAIEIASRRADSGRSRRGSALVERIERLHRLESQGAFFEAWSLYYQSWLGGSPDAARRAETIFAELLRAPEASPEPDDISVDLRATEPFARSILGMALSRLITRNANVSLAWLDLLEHERTHESVRGQVPGWRLFVLVEANEFRRAAEHLREHLEADEELPVMYLRLAGAYALKAPAEDAQARELALLSISHLSTRGELQQILELAEQYGVDALGEAPGGGGFAIRLVEGILLYQQARTEHADDDPTDDEAIRASYADAIEKLTRAVDEPDAERHREARATARRLIAWSEYFRAEFTAAHEAFLQAAEIAGRRDAEESLWMAIVCLDRALRDRPSEKLAAAREDLIERFLEEYPDSRRASTLIVSRVARRDSLSDSDIEMLRNVSPDDPAYPAARRRVAQVFYERFRTASGGDRVAAGSEYLNVALPIIHDLVRGDDADAGNAQWVERDLVEVRRVLEVAVHDSLRRLGAAEQALAVWDQVTGRPNVAPPPDDVRQEIVYRRVQHALIDESWRDAERHVDALWESDAHSLWSRRAVRLVFRTAYDTWREADKPDSRELLTRITHYGGRVLREYEDDPAALEQRAALGYHASVAEASSRLWQITEEQRYGRAALYLYQRLLEVHPRQEAFLRPAAELAEAFGYDEEALDAWRRLAAGLSSGTEAWYEARYHYLALLIEQDPDRARTVLQQHAALHPDYGPEPWGERLEALHRTLLEEDASE